MRHFKAATYWNRYCVSALSVFLATLLTFALAPLFPARSPSLSFTLAVIVSSWYGGLGPGLAATALGFLSVDYFFLPPVHTLFPVRLEDCVLLALYAAVGVAVSILTGKLSGSKAELDAVFSAMTDGIILIKDDGRVLANTEFAALFGFAGPEDVASRPLEELRTLTPVTALDGSPLAPEQHPSYLAQQGKSVKNVELRFERRGTREIWFGSCSAAPVRNGRVVGVVVSIRDITERRRAEELLEQSNRELKDFAALVSHDLQAPLNTMAVFSRWLSEEYAGKLGPRADRYLGFVQMATGRMQALIAGLLEHAKAGEQPACAPAPVDCNCVMERLLLTLNADIEAQHAAIRYGPLPTIVAREYQVEQLFQNLLLNALHYRSARPLCIAVSAEPSEAGWTFTVEDNGIGFDMADAERIFKPFERLCNMEPYGAGMGLAICRRIVERQGGRIWAESQPGAGSKFCFTLPPPKFAGTPARAAAAAGRSV